MGIQMNTSITAPYSVALHTFCLTFKKEWTKQQIVNWVQPANDLSLMGVKELEFNINFVCNYVQAMWNNVLVLPTREMPKNDDYWALEYLKCILHDLLVVLKPIKSYLAATLDSNISSEDDIRLFYQTIVRGIQRINLFVEKAFPLLKENKSYLDIDWNNEFKNL